MKKNKSGKTFSSTAVSACNKGMECYRSGQLSKAKKHFEKSLKREPGYPEALYGLGILELQNKNFAQAVRLLGSAIDSSPTVPVSYYYNLGGALRKSGDSARAVSCYKVAYDHGMDHPSALLEMGSIFRATGLYEEATGCFLKLISVNPENIDNHLLLGTTQSRAGNHDAAINNFRDALSIDPTSFRALSLLASELYLNEQEQECIDTLARAVKGQPDNMQLRWFLANHLASYGEVDAARLEYEQLLETGNNDGTRIRLATLCPVIMSSSTEIGTWRLQLNRELDSLLGQDLHVEDPATEVTSTNFFLAYHGQDDAPVQKKIAKVFEKASPSLNFTAPHCKAITKLPAGKGKIRVGLISNHFRGHSIGKTSVGLVRLLPRDTFHVVVLFIGRPVADLGKVINDLADEAVYLPSTLKDAQRQIADLKLDILFYQDIGMEPLTYFLSYARLAPIQCTSFGHPVTTGVPNIDYYISTEAWETEESDTHYTEKLVRLHDVSSVAYYYPPAIPEDLKSRGDFGLEDDRHIYICPQTIFKFHPEFDEFLAGILRKDPLGNVVLVKGRPEHWADLLRERFMQTIPDVIDRIIFLPRQRSDDFKNLIAVSDVSLDTIHFCGFNTTLEAFAAGVPVVTMPGPYMRSRHTTAFYKRMGFSDCVAANREEYIDVAIRLACDQAFRSRIVKKIEQGREGLWQEDNVIREFEKFFHSAVGSYPEIVDY